MIIMGGELQGIEIIKLDSYLSCIEEPVYVLDDKLYKYLTEAYECVVIEKCFVMNGELTDWTGYTLSDINAICYTESTSKFLSNYPTVRDSLKKYQSFELLEL